MQSVILLTSFRDYLHPEIKTIQAIINKIAEMKNANKILIALGAGVAIGGLLGVLFAPAKGVETRNKIAESGKKLKQQFNEKLKLGKEQLEEKMNGKMAEEHV
jgi:gas vesicle protein